MHSKQWIGAILVIFGVIAFLISHSIKGQVGGEMGQVRTIIGPLSQTSEEGKMAGGIIEDRASRKASGYLESAQFLMIAGVVLVLAGGVVIFLHKKRK